MIPLNQQQRQYLNNNKTTDPRIFFKGKPLVCRCRSFHLVVCQAVCVSWARRSLGKGWAGGVWVAWGRSRRLGGVFFGYCFCCFCSGWLFGVLVFFESLELDGSALSGSWYMIVIHWTVSFHSRSPVGDLPGQICGPQSIRIVGIAPCDAAFETFFLFVFVNGFCRVL